MSSLEDIDELEHHLETIDTHDDEIRKCKRRIAQLELSTYDKRIKELCTIVNDSDNPCGIGLLRDKASHISCKIYGEL